MKLRAMMLTLLLALTPTLAAAQRAGDFRPGGPPGRPGAMLRRQALQRQVFARFMDRVARRLALAPATRQQLEQVLRAHELRRRALAREARLVRRDLVAATADSGTTQADYERLLGRMADLRAQDLALWRGEQAELARVLTPRQRAQLMAMRMELVDMVQRARQARRGLPAEDTSGLF